MSDIVARSGVMPSTVRNLASGNAVRVSKKVLFALQRCVNHMQEPLPHPAERITEQAAAAVEPRAMEAPASIPAAGIPPELALLSGEVDFPAVTFLDASAFLDLDGIAAAIQESEHRLLRLRKLKDLSKELLH